MSEWRAPFGGRIVAGQDVSSDSREKTHCQLDWGTLFRGFTLVIGCLATGACAYPVSSLVRAEANPTLTLSKVVENLKAYLGSIVMWGGIVSAVSRGTEGTRLLVIKTPLDSHGRPQTQETEGEFIAWISESLDPRVYRKA
jgi:starvation-inducible outer membrane lipoprotein